MTKLHPFFYMKSHFEIQEFEDKNYKRLDMLYSQGEIDLEDFASQRCLLEDYIDEQREQLNSKLNIVE